MAHADEKIENFLETKSLNFVCKYSGSGQIFIPKTIMKYLYLERGKSSICFSVIADEPNKGQILFTKVNK